MLAISSNIQREAIISTLRKYANDFKAVSSQRVVQYCFAFERGDILLFLDDRGQLSTSILFWIWFGCEVHIC